ncbi:MAG: hypothetical protein AMXMBFR33_48920 [Candidatus Xenobia bacterium]
MRTLLALLLLTTLATAQLETPWFLGLDGGVYRGLQRVGLGTGTSLAVVGDTAYLIGQDRRLWSAGPQGNWQVADQLARCSRVAVASDGTVYLLGIDGGVYRQGVGRVGLGLGSDLAVGSGHDLFVVGTDGHIWISPSASGAWVPYNALALARRVAAGPEGTVALIGTDQGVYRVTPDHIERLGLATGQEVAVRSDGTVFIVGTDSAVYSYENGGWQRLGDGLAKAVVWPR